MAYLNKNSNSVPSLTGCIFTGTVLKLFYNAKGIINNFMRLASVNVYNRTNTTGIVFKRRFVQSIHFHVQLQKNAMGPQVQKQQKPVPAAPLPPLRFFKNKKVVDSISQKNEITSTTSLPLLI